MIGIFFVIGENFVEAASFGSAIFIVVVTALQSLEFRL